MKLITLTKISSALAAAIALASLSHADPLITGSIGFSGSATTNTGHLSNATSITSITNVSVQANTQTGSYATVPTGLSPVSFISSIAHFGALDPTEDPALMTAITATFDSNLNGSPLWQFTYDGNSYKFYATSISLSFKNSGNLDLAGLGWASISGYAATDGTWSIDLTNALGNNSVGFAFGADSAIPAVPDSGMTALLIGLGMGGIGLGLIARRRSLSRS